MDVMDPNGNHLRAVEKRGAAKYGQGAGLVETDELLHKLEKREKDKRIVERMRSDLSSRTEFVRTLGSASVWWNNLASVSS